MPANDVNSELNSEELRPPASVLRTLDFVRSRGLHSSVPGPDGTTSALGIGSLGLAAASLAQSLTDRALSPLVLGRPDWLAALLQRHRFASWSLGLPNLYYFYWLRATEEEKKDRKADSISGPIQRPITGRTPATSPSLPLSAAAPMALGNPFRAAVSQDAYRAPELPLAQRQRPANPEQDGLPERPSAVSPRSNGLPSVPLLPGTLNATSVLAPILTLHTNTAQGRSAAWTDSSLMHSAHSEVMAKDVVRRAQIVSQCSNASVPERAADSLYMPVSYPPVPLASWLGVSASAPEQAYWEAISGFARPQFSPASAHLLVLPKLVAEVRTRPDFDSPSETAFASLPRLGSAKTAAQIAGAASASVQAAQSAAVQPTRPSWPPSPMMPSGSPVVPLAPVSAERQPREPATASLDEPAAARRSPLAAARTALEVIQRLATQAAQTLSRRVFLPPLPPPSAAADTGHVSFLASRPSLLSLPRLLRRAPEAVDAPQGPAEALFFGVPSLVSVTRQANETVSRVPEPTRSGVTGPVLLEQLVAQRHQPVTAGTRRPASPPTGRIAEGQSWDDGPSLMSLPAAFSRLPLPLVSRAHIAEDAAHIDGPMSSRNVLTASEPSTVSPTAPLGGRLPTEDRLSDAPSPRPSSLSEISRMVLTRTAALIDSLASHVVGGSIAPIGEATEAPAFGTPRAAIRSFFGQLVLPQRRESLASDTPVAAPARPIAGMPSSAAVSASQRLGMPTTGQPPALTPSFFSTAPLFDLPLARRATVSGDVNARNDIPYPTPTQSDAITARATTSPQTRRHPVDFSADVAARYSDTAAEWLTEPPTTPRPYVLSNTPGVQTVSAQTPLSFLTVPLLRFLRLSDLRPGESESIGSVQQTEGITRRSLAPTPARRPIFGGFPAPIQTVNTFEDTAAGDRETVRPRILPIVPGAPPVFNQTLAASLSAPLLRFLHLSDLRWGADNETGSAQSAGLSPDVTPPSPPQHPIFGGVPAPIQAVKIFSATPAERLEAEQPRILSAATRVPPVFARTLLSSLAAPLLRFLRLSDFRRDIAGATESAQTERITGISAVPFSANRPIFGGTADPIQAIKIVNAVSAERLEAGQPRSLPALPGVPSISAQTPLPSLVAPLLRFLRLSDLRRDETETIRATQVGANTGSIVARSPASRPIFGGVPEPILSAARSPQPFESDPPDAPRQTARRWAGPFTMLPLTGLLHRPNAGDTGVSSTFGVRTGAGSAAARPGFRASPQEGDFDAIPIAPTAMQRFLSRWTQGAATPNVNREQSGISRWFLLRRPATGQETATIPTQDAGFGFGIDRASAASRTERGIGQSRVLPLAPRVTIARDDGVSGPAAFSEAGEEGMASTFQTGLLAPIREFLLSTLSRILSPLEALGQTPESRQALPEERGRPFRPDMIPDLLWWSLPSEDGVSRTHETETGWAAPSFPTLGLPAFGLQPSRTMNEADGLGTERRRAMDATQQTGLARSGLMALRLAAEHLSRSVIGQTNRETASVSDGRVESVMPSTSGQRGAQRLPFVPLSRTTQPASSWMGGIGSDPIPSTESGKMDTLRLGSFRMPLPSAEFLMSPERQQGEALTETPERVTGRLNIPSLASLPVRPAGASPVDASQGTAWGGGRTERTLAGRVPAMPLPMRSDRSDTAATQDPYVIQRAATGTAVASPAPQSLSTASASQPDGDQDGGGPQDVHGMASQVWTVLRARLAREASRAGNG